MPMPLPPEVPAYVQYENTVQNHVQVRGGTNWDFSRSAVTTPIAIAEEPAPVVSAPAYEPKVEASTTTTLKFEGANTHIKPRMKATVAALPKSGTYSVTARAVHPGPKTAAVTSAREKNVKSYMEAQGYQVGAKKSKPPVSGSGDKSGYVDIAPQ